MKHIKYPAVHSVKGAIDPAAYYSHILNGSLGRHTGHGWHLWLGLCPFHGDNNPGSFYIHKASGAYKCFSCGAKGGDIFAFHMRYTGCSFPEAIEQVGGVICENA